MEEITQLTIPSFIVPCQLLTIFAFTGCILVQRVCNNAMLWQRAVQWGKRGSQSTDLIQSQENPKAQVVMSCLKVFYLNETDSGWSQGSIFRDLSCQQIVCVSHSHGTDLLLTLLLSSSIIHAAELTVHPSHSLILLAPVWDGHRIWFCTVC